MANSSDKENEGCCYRRKKVLAASPRHDSNDRYRLGLLAIDRALRNLYPNEADHVATASPDTKVSIATAKNCIGTDTLPLDFIKVCSHCEVSGLNIPAHWHYISYGLSDLYGDGQIHLFKGRGFPSGYGFELTFRLKKDEGEDKPPSWPVYLLQNLARYVFNTGTAFHEYDHIPWPNPLNMKKAEATGTTASESTTFEPTCWIDHMIIAEDPKVPILDTPTGTVKFLQVLGIMKDEFKYSRSWTTAGMLDHYLDHPQIGPLLVTDMRRHVSVFEHDPVFLSEIFNYIRQEGTSMGQVVSHISWREINAGGNPRLEDAMSSLQISGCDCNNFYRLSKVYITVDAGAAELLPIMVSGRLKHGRNFVFTSPGCLEYPETQSIEFIPFNGDMSEAHVTEKSPLKADKESKYLEIFCAKKLIEDMVEMFDNLSRATEDPDSLPQHLGFQGPYGDVVISVYNKLPNELTCKIKHCDKH